MYDVSVENIFVSLRASEWNKEREREKIWNKERKERENTNLKARKKKWYQREEHGPQAHDPSSIHH